MKDIFCAEDAQRILQIPLRDGVDDFIAWHYDKRGAFSVKSAYKVAVDSAGRESLSGLTSTSIAEGENSSFNWKKLWALPLPNKVLHFLWRIATYSLPLRTKLHGKGIPIDTRCPLCHRMDEDGGHLFFKCKKVKNLWRESQPEHIRLKLVECHDRKEVFENIFTSKKTECLKVCLLLWLWWHERNNASKDEPTSSIQEVLSSIDLRSGQDKEGRD